MADTTIRFRDPDSNVVPVKAWDIGDGTYATAPIVEVVPAVEGVAATGYYDITPPLSNNETITVNGVVFTAKTSPSGAVQFGIGLSPSDQATLIQAKLAASTNPLVSAATYTRDGSAVMIMHNIPGVAGNAFTLTSTSASATPSGATLTSGVDAASAEYGLVVSSAGPSGTSTAPIHAKDAGPSWDSLFGVNGLPVESADMTTSTPLGDTPDSGYHCVLTDLLISVDTAMKVSLQRAESGDALVSFYMAANSTVQYTPRGRGPISATFTPFYLVASVVGNVSVAATYYFEAD